jgi:hypothetical protein
MRIQMLKNYKSQEQAIVKTFNTSKLVKREFGDCWRWAEGKRKGKPCPASVEEKIREALN